MTPRLFIGGPDCISGHMLPVDDGAIHWNVSVAPPFQGQDAHYASAFQLHEYRRAEFVNGREYHRVFFHNTIGAGHEMEALIKAATKP